MNKFTKEEHLTFLKDRIQNNLFDAYNLEFIEFPYLERVKGICKIFPNSNKDFFNKNFPLRLKKENRKDYIYFFKTLMINIVGKNERCIVSLDKKMYDHGGVYYSLFKYDWLVKTLDWMTENEYIIIKRGIKNIKRSIILPTEKLYYNYRFLQEYRNDIRNKTLVTGFSDNINEYRDLAKTVRDFEMFINKSRIDLQHDLFKEKFGYIGFKRIFNGKGKGGRWYGVGQGGEYQRLSKELRKQIKIDGEDTVELDFKCEHLNILYAMSGIDMWKYLKDENGKSDAYTLDGVSKEYRFILKVLLLILLNGNNEKRWFGTLTRSFLDKKDKWKRDLYFDKFLSEFDTMEKRNELLGKFKKKHQAISKFFSSGIGLKLQYKDSEIMTNILIECMNNKITVLPIHDSVIVKVKEKQKVIEIMKKCFLDKTGFNAIVE